MILSILRYLNELRFLFQVGKYIYLPVFFLVVLLRVYSGGENSLKFTLRKPTGLTLTSYYKVAKMISVKCINVYFNETI